MCIPNVLYTIVATRFRRCSELIYYDLRAQSYWALNAQCQSGSSIGIDNYKAVSISYIRCSNSTLLNTPPGMLAGRPTPSHPPHCVSCHLLERVSQRKM